MRSLFLLAALTLPATDALRLPMRIHEMDCKAAVAAALCSATLLVGQPSGALEPISSASPPLAKAIVETSQASYPILRTLDAGAFTPFSEKIGKIILGINPTKLGKSVDLGIDVLLSTPPESLSAFDGVVKQSFANLKPESCTLVPLPSAATVDEFTAVVKDYADSSRVKALDDKWGGTLKLLSRTDNGICLPSSEALDELSLAQADLARSFGAGESKKFSVFTEAMLKSAVSPSKVLPLVGEAKKLTPGATSAEKGRFVTAGKQIEAAVKRAEIDARLAELKAKSAAKTAAAAQ